MPHVNIPGDLSVYYEFSQGFEEAWDQVLSAVVRVAQIYNPHRPEGVWMSSTPNHRHPRLTPETLAKLRQPILILQGEQDLCFPVEDIADTVKHFTGSQGLQFHTIPDGPHLLAITHGPSVINMVQAFLLKYAHSPTPPVPFDFHAALQYASETAGNPRIAHRDPQAPDAFSLLDEEGYKAGATRFETMKRRGKASKLNLPMCFEKNDWEEGAAHQRLWTWSRRREYAQQRQDVRPMSVLSLGDGIAVEIERRETTG
ncbi:alpha/beta fold family hydrolase [Rhodotorula toruloides]|uniref:Alpha/beta fold family hydrolase n=1 Tax=Rhodotorula toruloides TaxID=5286 RepID=A0A511KG36_RHOTO|nr:alpha/beta fold family hydrolase [Rhodotorula toruloides]